VTSVNERCDRKATDFYGFLSRLLPLSNKNEIAYKRIVAHANTIAPSPYSAAASLGHRYLVEAHPATSKKGVDMLSQSAIPLEPRDPKCDPAVLGILRWLIADKTRILPPPDDDAGITELAGAIDKSLDYTRSLMAWSYGFRPGSETCKML
jgi:hypothetical protein